MNPSIVAASRQAHTQSPGASRGCALSMITGTLLAAACAGANRATPRTGLDATKTQILRDAIHAAFPGSCKAQTLAQAAGIESKMVGALLRQDIRSGRIEVVRGDSGVAYRHVATPPLAPYLASAVRKLEDLGYRVIAP